jgi:hypothetical protein
VLRNFLGLMVAMADALPEPVRVASSKADNRSGVYVAALAFAAAVIVAGVTLIRRRKG